MPPPAPRRARLAVALLGYAATFAACLFGMACVLVVWAAWAFGSIAYLVWTGRFAEVRSRRWW